LLDSRLLYRRHRLATIHNVTDSLTTTAILRLLVGGHVICDVTLLCCVGRTATSIDDEPAASDVTGASFAWRHHSRREEVWYASSARVSTSSPRRACYRTRSSLLWSTLQQRTQLVQVRLGHQRL